MIIAFFRACGLDMFNQWYLYLVTSHLWKQAILCCGTCAYIQTSYRIQTQPLSYNLILLCAMLSIDTILMVY